MKTNYHTHHKFCNHAVGTTEDYVREAIKHGFTVLGMSDHAPFDWMNDSRRMKASQYPLYLKEIEEIKTKYINKINLLKGLEIEYFPIDDSVYKTFRNDLDFTILGQHYIYFNDNLSTRQSSFALNTQQEIKTYGVIVVKAIKSGYFDIIAHPDVYLNGYKEFDDTAREVAYQICNAAKKHDVILEYNANGYRKNKITTSKGEMFVYPRHEFFDIARKVGAKTILSSDCHAPNLLYDHKMEQAEKDYHALNLIEITTL